MMPNPDEPELNKREYSSGVKRKAGGDKKITRQWCGRMPIFEKLELFRKRLIHQPDDDVMRRIFS